MKKLISLLLVACFMGAFVFSFAGCSLFTRKIDEGTEAAKLLLANERLDADLVGEKIDLGINGTRESIDVADIKTAVSVNTGSSAISRGNRELTPTSYTWSGFDNFSFSMIEFTQFMDNVEHEAKYVSEDIANMKQNVGVIDKWVKVGHEQHMLRVYESADLLLVKGEYDDVHIYYRYTNENAKNVYEMYSYLNYDDGTTGEIKTILIPGERCEYFYNNSNGFSDYFISENSRGYWTATRFGYTLYDNGSSNASFYPYIIRDGLGYGTVVLYENNQMAVGDQVISCSVFDPNNNRDILSVVESADSYIVSLDFSGIKSGLVSVSSNEAFDHLGDGKLTTTSIDTLVTSNGTYQASQSYEEDIAFSGGSVYYDYAHNKYYGSITFRVSREGNDITSAVQEMRNYAQSLGLELYCSDEEIATSVEHAYLFSKEFGNTFSWYGTTIDSVEDVEDGMEKLQNDFDSAYEKYEEVKDFEIVSSRKKLSSSAHFAELETVLEGGNTFSGSLITISALSLLSTDIKLFEEGGEYIVKIGLSLIDENGNPISVNTIPLSGDDAPVSVFSGDSITLSASGKFLIPKNLDSGKYVAVAYVATRDEGIRVSEMKKIAFLNIAGGEIESSAMAIEAYESNSNLVIEYEIKNVRYITIEASQEAYSYDEIKRAIMIEILSYGAPYYNAVLEGENGEAISQGASLGAGTYRMMCYLQTSDGLAQSYIYLTVD